MTSHEKAIKLINDLGIAAKKVAEIINPEKPSQDSVYKKLKNQSSNKFTDENFEKIKNHVLSVAKTLDKK